jgi:fatty-acyl-CoA synthase
VERARLEPDHRSVTLIKEDWSEETMTAAQFLVSAVDCASAMKAADIHPRDIVILVMRQSKELLSALWGALYLGAIPSIFPFLSEKLDRSLYMEQVRTLVAHCRARAVIVFPEFKSDLATLLSLGQSTAR